jgi:glucose/arabinose dehydrogenase
VTATRIRSRVLRLALLTLAALPLTASAPRFISGEAVFPVAGDLPDGVLQPLPGAQGLAFPTSVTHAGDDRLFLTLRDGRIVIYSNGAVLPTPFLDVRSLVDTQGEGGLLSAAFHPRYAENGFFFVNYTDSASFDTIVARYEVSAGDPNRADPASARVLLRIDQPFSNHNGGQIQFGPDGFLYVGMGDGGAGGDPDCRAQRNDTLLGKMLRLDVDQNVGSAPFYGIPADNPFRGNDGVPDEVWARGFRNPWRFSFDRETGDLYIGDVGQSAREEIDLQPADSPGGENYGWKVMEGTLCFGTSACPASTPPCNSPALTLPILEYANAGADCSVIGGYVYRGSRLPQLRGVYLFGDLCSGRIWGANPQGGGWRVRRLAGAESALQDQSLIAFGEDRHGELYVATSSAIYRLDPRQATPPPGGGHDVGLFDPATVTFFIKTSLTSGPADLTFRFGRRGKGWIPVTGDWNGDGHDTIGYWDATTRSFRLRNSLSPGSADLRFFLTQVPKGWIPLVGDWNGDGRDGVGFYDPATSTFRVKNKLGPGGFGVIFRFGQPRSGAVPVVGDWNGDGRDTVGLFDPATGTFRLRNSLSDGNPDVVHVFPNERNETPLVGDWDGDGVDTPGFYRKGPAAFALTGRTGTAIDTVFQFGTPGSGWVPLVGRW